MNENDVKSLIELIRNGDLEEFSRKLSSAFEEAFRTSKGLSVGLQEEFQIIFEMIKNDTTADEWIKGWSGNIDELKEKFTELIKDYVEQKDLV
jgi:ketol-acid reductoisomerase